MVVRNKLSTGLVVAPEIHCFSFRKGKPAREVITAPDVPAASSVIWVNADVNPVNGNPYVLAQKFIEDASGSTAVALALEIAMAHIVARKTLENDGDDVGEWLRIQRDLADDVLKILVNEAKAGAA